jgi:hypothetical protein
MTAAPPGTCPPRPGGAAPQQENEVKTAIVAMLLATAIVSPSNAGEVWQPGQPLTSDNILSYVFQDRGRAKIFTEADQRREEATRPVVIKSSPAPRRIRSTICSTSSGRGYSDTVCTSN